jgi:nicotinic acetylcholine receptor
MLLIAENVPTTSETIPLIGTYLTVVMALTSLSIAFTIFVLELHHSTRYAPQMSRRLFHFLTLRLAPKIGLKNVVTRFQVSQSNALLRAKLNAQEKMEATAAACNSGGGGGSERQRRSRTPTQIQMQSNHIAFATFESGRSQAQERLNLMRQLAEHEDTIDLIQREWKLVAIIIDRLLFRVFSSLTVIFSVILLALVPFLKNTNLLQAQKTEDSSQ